MIKILKGNVLLGRKKPLTNHLGGWVFGRVGYIYTEMSWEIYCNTWEFWRYYYFGVC